ncbi:MAG: cupin domain-containing protein [Planctomycetes bacterium]|nr:cupin domain-containing protein [Planctomycetota bacterium]
MPELFPEMIRALPEADIPIDGLKGYILQSDNHQILFMKCDEDAEVPEHTHESHWSVVMEGKINLTIDGVKQSYTKGDSFVVPKGSKHSAKIYAGYTDLTVFNEKDRYKRK